MTYLKEYIKQFRFAKFKMEIVAGEKGLDLPEYKGFSVRGGFGTAFRKLVCKYDNKACVNCILKDQCPYSYIFETSPPKNAGIMKKFTSVPRPYVIEPPMDKKTHYHNNERLSFGLILFGDAIKYLPYFIFTFDRLGDLGIGKGRKPYRLEKVYSVTPIDNVDKVVYSTKQCKVVNDFNIITGRALLKKAKEKNLFGKNKLTLQLKTPMRIKHKGKYANVLEFPILLGNLVRRFSNISYFHMNSPISFDYNKFTESAKDIRISEDNTWWHDIKRYSNRQKRRMKMGGLVGSISYVGNFKKYLPLLLLGENLHVGKNTVMGFGKYQILMR